MRSKSSITWLVQRLFLFSVFLAACLAENAIAQTRPFVNLSTRAEVLDGQNVIVAGFIIETTATTTKQVLIRGLGPSYSLSLADPTITLNGPNGVIYSNNNWRDDVNQANAIAATGMQPGNDLESAILWTLPAGSYSVTLGSNNGGTGIGLVELYDMGGAAPIVNLSSRARVGTGDNVLIGGVYVQDSTRAVVRAIGPSLGQYGIQGALQDPTLELHDANGIQIAFNDNWQSDPQWPEIQQLGLQPTNGNESAILSTLGAGRYTVIVRGLNNTTGVGMVELYALEDAAYPRVFQNWANAYNPSNPSEDPMVTVAKHDLFWTTHNGFGWNWVDSNGAYTDDYHSETISLNGTIIPYPIPTLRNLNPKIKILCEVMHYQAPPDALPPGDPWWKRDQNGNRILGPGGNTYLLNEDDPSLRSHVARQAAALMQTGQFDGIMLDECRPNTSYLLPLLTEVRNTIGGNGLIIVNVNANKLTQNELGQINGIFMESGYVGTPSPSWQTVKDALDWNETYTRTPRVNCLQDWYSTSPTDPTDLRRMRAITALSLTHSNGYVNFGHDQYYWYDPFWSKDSLGLPTGNWYLVNGYGHRRDFKHGSAVWNSSGYSITVTFSEMRTSQPTDPSQPGQRAMSFVLPPNDGGIYTY